MTGKQSIRVRYELVWFWFSNRHMACSYLSQLSYAN